MPRKCSVGACKTLYDSQVRKALLEGTDPKIKVFSLPKDDEERKKWLLALPNKPKSFDFNKNFEIRRKHWPDNVPTRSVKIGHIIPAVPPSLLYFLKLSPHQFYQPLPRSVILLLVHKVFWGIFKRMSYLTLYLKTFSFQWTEELCWIDSLTFWESVECCVM